MNEEKIQTIITDLLTRMGVAFESVSRRETDGRTNFVIKSSDSHILIGSRGAHIASLNHVVKRIVSKQLDMGDQKFDFFVDVNDYHDRLVKDLQDKANILAGRARSFKTNVEMDPMSSYERMIIHNLFQDVSDITTESIGVGSKRRVVIKYTEVPRESIS